MNNAKQLLKTVFRLVGMLILVMLVIISSTKNPLMLFVFLLLYFAYRNKTFLYDAFKKYILKGPVELWWAGKKDRSIGIPLIFLEGALTLVVFFFLWANVWSILNALWTDMSQTFRIVATTIFALPFGIPVIFFVYLFIRNRRKPKFFSTVNSRTLTSPDNGEQAPLTLNYEKVTLRFKQPQGDVQK